MVVQCPNCEARFKVPSDALGPAGRRVRCGDCGHTWRAYPDEAGGGDAETEASAADTGPSAIDETAPFTDPDPPAAEAALDAPSETDAPVDNDDNTAEAGGEETPSWFPEAEAEAAVKAEVGDAMRRLQAEEGAGDTVALASAQAALRARRLILAGWAAWAVFVVTLIAGGLVFQDSIARAWPPAQKLYAGLGLSDADAPPDPVEAGEAPDPEEALSVRFGSQPDWQALQSGWRLTVTGQVANAAVTAVALPELTLILMDAEQRALKRVPLRFERESLGAGESFRFERVVDDAPAETAGIAYEWSESS